MHMTTTIRGMRCWATAALTLVLAACGSTQVGSRYVKSENVAATQGAVLAVSASDSPALAGTKLEIPANALAADTTITLEVGMEPLVANELVAGPVAVWGPAGTTFRQPARMTLPLDGLEAGDELSIFVREADGRVFEIAAQNVVVDAAAGTVSFSIDGFTRFQPLHRRPCNTNADCQQGLACVNSRCRPSGGCQADADCPRGYVCDAAMTNGQGCPTGSSCAGVCQPQPPQCQNCPPGVACVNGACAVSCGNVIACPPGSQCINGTCSGSCVTGSTNACPAGQVCDPSGQCVLPPAQCGSNSMTPNCPPGAQCINGACVALCNANTICAQGLVCDLQRGLCVPPGPPTPQCASDRDCPQGAQCLNGLCISGCGANGMTCPPGEVCDPTRGLCVPGNPPPPACTATQGCPNGDACVNGVCVPSCTSAGNVGCPPGTQCDPNRNVCVPVPTGCGTAGQACSNGQVCLNGQCVAACTATGSITCPQGSSCDPTTGACVPNPGQCSANGACAPGEVCVGGRCVWGCNATGSNGCPPGSQCDPTVGQCVPTPTGCGSGTVTCTNGQVCVNNQCLAACTATGSMGCPSGTACDPNTGACVPSQTGCGSNGATCSNGQVCLNGQCVTSCNTAGTVGCPSGSQCDATTGQCVPTPTGCGSNTSCSNGQVCINGQCLSSCTATGMTCPQGTQCDAQSGICR
jgi:hypothetical protein